MKEKTQHISNRRFLKGIYTQFNKWITTKDYLLQDLNFLADKHSFQRVCNIFV